jgi:sugar fermentation stimulation protein A
VFQRPFTKPISEARLIKRYKRFLADVELEGGGMETVHCPNSGSMLGCAEPGSRVLVSYDGNPKRKLPYTLEAVRVGRTWVGVNTSLPNAFMGDVLRARLLPSLSAYGNVRAEVPLGKGTRLDFLLTEPGLPDCYLEVKNVTLREGSAAIFPDCKTERGAKHMRELAHLARQGHRAAVVFFVQRDDCERFAPARHLDPAYADALQEAHGEGVTLLPLLIKVERRGLSLRGELPFSLDSTMRSQKEKGAWA